MDRLTKVAQQTPSQKTAKRKLEAKETEVSLDSEGFPACLKEPSSSSTGYKKPSDALPLLPGFMKNRPGRRLALCGSPLAGEELREQMGFAPKAMKKEEEEEKKKTRRQRSDKKPWQRALARAMSCRKARPKPKLRPRRRACRKPRPRRKACRKPRPRPSLSRPFGASGIRSR